MNLGDRMKLYEAVPKIKLMRRTPVILRLDGKSFHTYTRGFEKPWDKRLFNAMTETTKFVCENISGAKLAYTQSDEISILITDYDTLETEPWFDYQVQKIVSVAASMATHMFSKIMRFYQVDRAAFFDCRVANYPKEEVLNYFIWRQKDAERNSIQGLAQSLFSHKEIQGISNNELQDKMLTEKNVNWNDCEVWQKRGSCIIKTTFTINNTIIGNDTITGNNITRNNWVVDLNTPIFTQNREYISKLLEPKE